MKPTEQIKLSKEQKLYVSEKLKNYISVNLEFEMGNLQAGFLVDFISKEIASVYYNMGVSDSMTFMTEKADELFLLMKDEDVR